jgi:2,3-bisphosphoglycerate-dependent phosphoglycerate mutase
MKLHIYLFRHGQTTYNRDKRFTGWLDAKLTKSGIKQAKIVAKKLKNKKFGIAYSNDLSRCVDTLKEVLKYHPECKKIILDKRIRERSYGKFQGKYHYQIINKYGKEMFDKWHRDYDFPPPNGESIKMVEKRVLAFIKELLKTMKKEKTNVAISASGNSMRPFRRYFEHLTIKQMMKLENPWDDYFEYVVEVK